MVLCCKDCQNRHEICHITCRTYLDAVDKDRADKERRKAEIDGRNYDAARGVRINKRMDRYRK